MSAQSQLAHEQIFVVAGINNEMSTPTLHQLLVSIGSATHVYTSRLDGGSRMTLKAGIDACVLSKRSKN